MEDSNRRIGMKYFFIILALFCIACSKSKIEPMQENQQTDIMEQIIEDKTQSSENDKVLNGASKTLQEFNETLTKERDTYKIKCDNKNGDSCIKLALSYYVESPDSNADLINDLYKRAAIYLQDSCDREDYHACSALGGLYETGDGVGKIDRIKSTKLYKIACDGKDSRGCFNLGVSEIGCLTCQITDKNKILKSLEYFKRACEYGSATSCYTVGNIYMQNENIEKDQLSLAKQYLQKACEMGDKRGCV